MNKLKVFEFEEPIPSYLLKTDLEFTIDLDFIARITSL